MRTEKQKITDTIQHYFLGTYEGDQKRLKKAFHPDARITGNFHGNYCDWTLHEFFQRVTAEPTASVQNEEYNKEIIFIEQTGDAAIVKARVIVGGQVFTDYITLLKIDKSWLIRNKSFTTALNE